MDFALNGPQTRGLPDYSEVSWLSFLTFGWITPVVAIGVERQVNVDDTPGLARAEDTVENTNVLLSRLDWAERTRKMHPLLRAVVDAFWLPLLALQCLNITGHLLTLQNPLLMQQVLIFQERQNDKELTEGKIRQGFLAVAALIMFGFFMILWNSQVALFQARLGLRIGSALRGAVLSRCTQARPAVHGPVVGGIGEQANSGSSTPTVYNVLSFDVGPNIEVIWILLGLWLFPFQLASTAFVLYREVKWAVVPGLFTIIIAKIVCGTFLIRDGFLRHRLLLAKDKRMDLCDEGFKNIRTVQMLSWVGSVQKRIIDARQQELNTTCQRLWMTKMVAALDYSLGPIVTLATLSYYVTHSGGHLKASVAIPVISLVNSLSGPFGQFPVWAQQYLIWRSAYNRVNNFMGLEVYPQRATAPRASGLVIGLGGLRSELPAQGTVAELNGCTLSWGAGSPSQQHPEAQKCCEGDIEAAALQSANLSKASTELLRTGRGFSLEDLDLRLRSGELTVLLGEAGQGKSSLLHGLLGELAVESGVLRTPALERGISTKALPATTHDARVLLESPGAWAAAAGLECAVPFSPQGAMLFTGSIRFNITLGVVHVPKLYERVLQACALEADLATMPAGDLSEVAQGGATLSGGQRARVALARAVYHAAFILEQRLGTRLLVLLDDPFCSLDQRVAREVCAALFAPVGGLLSPCAVVVATADPWWLNTLLHTSTGGASAPRVRLVVLRGGCIAAAGTPAELTVLGTPELHGLQQPESASASPNAGSSDIVKSNPQEDAPEPQQNPQEEPPAPIPPTVPVVATKSRHSHTQTPLTPRQQKAAQVLQKERREEGQVKCGTYSAYLTAVGPKMLAVLALALSGIMVFQNCCALWIVYWTEKDKTKTFMYGWVKMFTDQPPTEPQQLLRAYACFVLLFTLCNVCGHALEIMGGIGAARRTFAEALEGVLAKAFLWWDANPTGRVLNRFSEDVEVMDTALTSTMGVIFGAVLYFFGHSFVLALANPLALMLLPPIAAGLEYFAKYYRATIREVHRNYLACMSTVYQDMVEAIVGRVVIRAHASERLIMCRSMDSLDRFQQISFVKYSVQAWLGFRMACVSYLLSIFTQLRPVLQFCGVLPPESAALVGFSISYSTELVGIIQQFINDYSNLEMQFISIERLREYARGTGATEASLQDGPHLGGVSLGPGLHMRGVEVRYREGLAPALSGVSLDVSPEELVAIMGRTGAGKTSLLLSVLQLVPYSGRIEVDGERLAWLPPTEVRRRLVGVVPQSPVVFAGDLAFNLDPDRLRSEGELWAALEAVGLQAACRARGRGLKVEIGGAHGQLALSQGQQQLLCAARALLRRPRVALLDEVSASLPAELAAHTVSVLLQRFRERGAAVLLVTHQEKLVPLCGRVVTINAGQVASDCRTEAVRFP